MHPTQKQFSCAVHSCSSLKLFRQLQEILRRISVGFAKNTTVTVEDALRFIHAILSTHLPQCDRDLTKKERMNTLADNSAPNGEMVQAKTKNESRNAQVLVEFAFQLMSSLTSKGFFDESEEVHKRNLGVHQQTS